MCKGKYLCKKRFRSTIVDGYTKVLETLTLSKTNRFSSEEPRINRKQTKMTCRPKSIYKLETEAEFWNIACKSL